MNTRTAICPFIFFLVLFSCGGEEKNPDKNKNEKKSGDQSFSLTRGTRPDHAHVIKALSEAEEKYSGNLAKYIYTDTNSNTVFWSLDKYDILPVFGLLKDEDSEWELIKLEYPVEAVPAYGFPQFAVEEVHSELKNKQHYVWAVIHITGVGGVAEDGERPEIDDYSIVAFNKNANGKYEYNSQKSKEAHSQYMARRRNEKMQWMSLFRPGVKMEDRRDINQFITNIMSHRLSGEYTLATVQNGTTYCCNCPPYAIGFAYSEGKKDWTVFYDLRQDSRDLFILSVTRRAKYWDIELELRFMDTISYNAKLDTLWLDVPVSRLTLSNPETGHSVFINDLHLKNLPKNPEECDLEEGYE